MNEFSGKTALITGGSQGIGRAIAIALAESGASVAINYVGHDDMAEEVRRHIRSSGGDCQTVKADLFSADCACHIAQAVPSVDILVLNASVQYRRPWQEVTLEEFDRQVYINFRSALLLIQQYAPFMEQKGRGRIIIIGSVQEKRPHPDMLVYSSIKAALSHMTQSLAAQLAPVGITVNSVAPGVIETARNRDALRNEEYRAAVLKKIPAQRFGQTQDCAGIVRFLCSEEARYITGQHIFVDGGMGIYGS